MLASNLSKDPSGFGGVELSALLSNGISRNPFSFLRSKPEFHILTPNTTATIMLTVGNTTPIAIVPDVLKPPPVFPFPEANYDDADCDEEEVCGDEDAVELTVAVKEAVALRE